MQQSGGLLLVGGWTATTPLFSPQAKMQTSPVSGTIKAAISNGIAAFILLVQGLEQLNATVRRTVACRRLDGDNTSIFATGENANESRQ